MMDMRTPSRAGSPGRCRRAHAWEMRALAGGCAQGRGQRALGKSTALYGREKSHCSKQHIQDRAVPASGNFTVL